MTHHILQFDGASLEVLAHARAACAQIPPAFALEATVAVNPWLGQAAESPVLAAARLARVAGAPLTRHRAEMLAMIADGEITEGDLAGALATSDLEIASVEAVLRLARQETPKPKALASLAELAATASGQDWPRLMAGRIGLWAAGHFDRGQAFWPAPELSVWASWRSFAARDLTLEIHGLKGFCAMVEGLSQNPDLALLDLCAELGITPQSAPTLFHRTLMSVPGWAQYVRGLAWQSDLAGETCRDPEDLLVILLALEAALLRAHPALRETWAEVVAAHAAPLVPPQAQHIDALLQVAAEHAEQRRLAVTLAGASTPEPYDRAALQAVFCIDVRSEVFRRHLEAQSHEIETFGFAGFFGLAIAHHEDGSDVCEARAPALLSPGLKTTTAPRPSGSRVAARAARAWGRFRQAAVSSFAFVEAVGLVHGAKLLNASLGGGKAKANGLSPRLVEGHDAATRAEMVAGALRGMGLTKGFAPLVLIAGHDAHVSNAPHASALACGACGGHGGAVNARLLAMLANDAEVRACLAPMGIKIPEDTLFVGAQHITTTDAVTLFLEDLPHALDPLRARQLRTWLAAAGLATRSERATRLPAAASARDIQRRATDWAETRPEWGLAGCAAFIAAPRSVIRGVDLGGRAFLHEFRFEEAGVEGLEAILTAPVVVASWISLQYFGSVVAPQTFGGGSKLVHNVVGGFGVTEGADGQLRTGLPVQSVHDGRAPVHSALRLTVCLAAPEEAISTVLARQPAVRALFDNGWLHLVTLDGQGQMSTRYRPGGAWTPMGERKNQALNLAA